MVFHSSPLKISILEFLRYVKRTFEEISHQINNNNKGCIFSDSATNFLKSVINLDLVVVTFLFLKAFYNLRPQSEQSG